MQLRSYLALTAIFLLPHQDTLHGYDGFFRRLQKRSTRRSTPRKEEQRKFEGDIDVDPRNVNRHAVPGGPDTWVDRRVTFILDTELDPDLNVTIKQAMQTISGNTCIWFDRKKRFDNDYINITSRFNGCYSSVGRRGGPQILSLARNCNQLGIVLHELLHALGFWHEQSRSDRDGYVTVLLGNVSLGDQNNFNKRTKEPLEDHIVYDYDSILHYGYNQFSKNGKDTIVPVDDNVNKTRLGQREMLSRLDVQRIQWLYDCDKRRCSAIYSFANGYVRTNSYGVGGRANYICQRGFKLIGAKTRICKADGTWSGATPYCVAVSLGYTYRYYNMDSITQLSQNLSVRWIRQKGQTPTEDTGPHVDHTSQDSTGWYIYLEASGLPINSTAKILTSPIRYYRNKGACLLFWYYMYGDGMGELNVYVHNNSYKNLVWSSTDNGILQQKNWNMATINNAIITLPVSGSSYRVEFEAIRGYKPTSDIGVDDVLVGQCTDVVRKYFNAVKMDEKQNEEIDNSRASYYGRNYMKKLG